MQNRRSFFGAMLGGIAACFGISRQVPASCGSPGQVLASGGKFRGDDVVYLGMHNGQNLWAELQFEHHHRTIFRFPEEVLSVISFLDLLEIVNHCPETKGHFSAGYFNLDGNWKSCGHLELTGCKIWREPGTTRAT